MLLNPIVLRSFMRMIKGDLQMQNKWKMQCRLAAWFPHVEVSVKYIRHPESMSNMTAGKEYRSLVKVTANACCIALILIGCKLLCLQYCCPYIHAH